MQNPKCLINHVLNEKAGVIEFDNVLYRKQICQIVKDIKNATQFNDVIELPILEDYKFAKFSYNFSNIVSWLKTLNVYYAIAENEEFDVAVITDEIDNIFQKDPNGNIEVATIYIIDNFQENLTFILFHEMCHIYDYCKFKSIWMEDEKYFLGHKDDYDINAYDLLSDVDSFSARDIHNIITASMYYANFTESHAFMENINFEMFEYLNKRKKEFFAFNDKEQFFYRSSKTLYDIYILEKLIGKLRYIDRDKKYAYMNHYASEIKLAYYNFNQFDNMICYIFKKLHKIIAHSRALFNYYFNLDSKAQKIFQLSESLKQVFIRGYTSSNRRFPSD